jgi:hypothetical protein
VTGRVVDATGAPLPAVTVAVGGCARRRRRTAGSRSPACPRASVEVVAGYVDGRRRARWTRGRSRRGRRRPAASAATRDDPAAARRRRRFRAVRGLDGSSLSWVRAVVLDGAGDLRFDGMLPLDVGEGRIEARAGHAGR